MGPTSGSNCRDLVMPVVVKGICFNCWIIWSCFYILVRGCSGDTVSRILDLSLSTLWKCLHLTYGLSLGTETRLFPHDLFFPSHLHSQELARLPRWGCPRPPCFFRSPCASLIRKGDCLPTWSGGAESTDSV